MPVTVGGEQVMLVVGGVAVGAAIATFIYRASVGKAETNVQKAVEATWMQKITNPEQQQLLSQLHSHMPTQNYSLVPSMEDCLKLRESAAAEMDKTTPEMVLKSLQQGNARFWMGVAKRPEVSAMERRVMIMQQFPKAAILGCSDSRVPIEIVFDQGLGDSLP